MIKAADYPAIERLSSGQQKLVQTALTLLESPRTIQSGPYYIRRHMSSKEKIQWLFGMMLGATLNDFSDKVVGARTTNTLEVKRADIKHGPDTSSGGGMYLQRERVYDFDKRTKLESLTLYASSVTNGKFSFTENEEPKRDLLWYINLLEPIDDSAEIKRFQSELDVAAERFRNEEN